MSKEIATTENRSLVNLCLDLVELDPEAPENKELIDSKISALGEKVTSYVMVDKFADSQIDMLEKELEFIEKQLNNYKKLQEKLRERALFVMDTLGVNCLKGDNGHRMTITPSHSVEVINSNEIPVHLTRFVPAIAASRAPDKLAIKEELRSGKTIEGCKLITKRNVQFK